MNHDLQPKMRLGNMLNISVQIFCVNFLSDDNVLNFLIPTGLSTFDPFPYTAKFHFFIAKCWKKLFNHDLLVKMLLKKCATINILKVIARSF